MPKQKKVVLITVGVALLATLVLFLTPLMGTSAPDQQVMFTGSEDHRISVQEARAMIQSFRQTVSSETVIGGFFGRDVLQSILSQPGVVGIRAYFALEEDGSPTLVLVGVNERGDDIVEGSGPAERWFPCPPFCPTNSELLQDHYAFKNR